MEQLPSFPLDGRVEKPVIVNYCPRCGTKAQKGEKNCLNCGRDFTQPVTLPGVGGSIPTPSLTKRFTGITIICVLWFFGGLLNVFGGLAALGDDLYALSLLNSLPSGARMWASWAIPLETMLVFSTVVMGLLQFATIYGLWNGKRWALKYAIGLASGLILANWVETFILMTAPSFLGIQPDFTMVIIATIMGAVYISYLKKNHVKKYLGGE